MKVAIFHNFLDNIGGAEIVDLVLARELKADIYTTNIDVEKIKKMGFESVLPRIYSIGKIPVNAPWKQEFAYWRFRFLNIEKKFRKKYDFYVIAGDWAMSGALNNKPNLWYVYSPVREIWDLYEYTRENIVSFWKKPIFDVWVLFRRYLNRRDVKHVEKIVSISENVKERVKRYLKRGSVVVYPPIEVSNYKHKKSKGYWLSVNRLINHKRIELQMNAFRKLKNERLIVVGSYEKSEHFKKYANYIKSIKPKNVEILSWVDKKRLVELYACCKGLICTSKNEDFGLTPLEAMASGKPVIAPNEGGYKETIIHGKTGVLIDNIDEENLKLAVERMSKELKKNPKKYKEECLKQAKRFDLKVFVESIKKELK